MASNLLKQTRFLRNLRNLNRNYHHDNHHLSKLEVDVSFRNTADFLPQARGSFKELDAKRQSVNNATLVVGIVLFISAVVGTAQFGMWGNVYFRGPKDKISKDFPGAKFE